MKKWLQGCASLAVAVGVSSAPAHAQNFPVKPVTIILPFPVGTGPDSVMRLVADKMNKRWGQPVIIENRPGGRAFIAMEAVKKAAPDGYTLVQVDPGIISLAPHLYQRVPYDPVKDFVPVAPMYKANYMIAVAANSPWHTLSDLVAAAKRPEGKIAYGSSGVGSPMHLGAAMVQHGSDAPMMHVPYKDTNQVFVDVARGELAWAFGTVATTKPLYENKKLKYLAVGSPERDPEFPDVPTVAEAVNLPGFDHRTWLALYAPAGTPRNVVLKINESVTAAMNDPSVQAQLPGLGAQAWTGSPEELAETQKQASERFSALVKKIDISIE